MFSKKQLLIYAGELVVIIVGILIAFQVEEWREGLQQERDLQASLVRLKEETTINLERCARAVPAALRKTDSGLFILNALQTRRLEPGDVEQFESALTRLSGLRMPGYVSTVADEMIATGLLRELRDPELRTAVAGLPGRFERTQNDYAEKGQALERAFDELNRRVEFRYQGSLDVQTIREKSRNRPFEANMTVKYDFDALTGDPYFVNLMIEAADSFGDLYDAQQLFCDATEEVSALLED
jgi:hypothetical protein